MDGQNFNNGNNYQDYTANVNPYEEVNAPVTTNGMQIASLVLGILGILTCCCYGIPAIILGTIGVVLAVLGNKKGRTGVGIAGLVCSIIAIVFGVAVLIYFVVVIGAALSGGLYEDLLYDLQNGGDGAEIIQKYLETN